MTPYYQGKYDQQGMIRLQLTHCRIELAGDCGYEVAD